MEHTVAFLAFDKEIYAGAAVKLINDYAFGTVNNEFAAADHLGNFAQVDRLLGDIFAVFAI